MISSALTRLSKYVALILIGVFSLFIVFYRFTAVPKNLTFDEIEFAKLALSLENKPYTPYSPLATGHSTMYFYILLSSLKTFGINSFALRLPSALFGVLSAILIFFIFKKTFSNRSELFAFIGAFLFITTRWYFNFARFGFEGTFLIFLELMSLLFLLRYIVHRQHVWLIPTGIFSGLAYNSYQPGRLFFIVPLVLLFIFILERKQNRLDFSFFSKHTVITFLTFLIPFIICITPLSVYLSQHADVRLQQLMYVTNDTLSVNEKAQYLGKNISATALMFAVKGDVNGRHNYPNKAALNPVMSVLLFIGIILALLHITNKRNQLFLLYFCVALFPTLLTNPWENPNMLRTITSIPAIIYFASYALMHGYEYVKRKLKVNNRIVIVVLFVLVSSSALYDVRTYYVFQQPVFSKAFEATMPLQYYIDHTDVKAK